jgi:capsular exopolysaccharide synthesis family protein
MLSGLSLCAAFLIVRARADRTVQAPGEVRAWLDVPELQVIPSLSKELSRSSFVSRMRKPWAADPTEPANARYKLSAVAESFRALRSSLLFFGENGHHPQVVVLTSAGPREGKTIITSNLAMALAAIRCKVLIIDGDLRKPRMHEVFELPNTSGLSTLLTDVNASCPDLNAFVQATALPGLWVLTSGPGVENPADLLHSPRLAELLRNAKAEYEFVIIDTPPMLTMPDARIVGRLSDGVILVIRAAKTTREAAEAARQHFSGDRTPVLGTILNDWDPSKNSRGSERYYNCYSSAS